METNLPGVLILEPIVFEDARGSLMETFHCKRFQDLAGFDGLFVQDNQSLSVRGVLRGLHHQVVRPQGKLVRVVSGEVFDVAVDLRRSSPHFGRWAGVRLSAHNRRMLWIPPGFAHGMLALAESNEVLYKMTEYWIPANDRAIRWDDPTIGIDWPLDRAPILSEKDRSAPLLADAETYS